MRWTYETPLGRAFLAGIVRKVWFSRLYGSWANCSCSRKEVAKFIDKFDIDESEFEEPAGSFKTFNDFFSRELKPSARPINQDERSIIFPADGRHLYLPDLSDVDGIYAKGQRFSLPQLLGSEELACDFQDGAALLSRLCPTDYHRFHFPLAGTPGVPKLINGPLYSVNPIALRRSIRYASENKRQVTLVRESPVGDYLFLEVGATNVGTIVLTSESGEPVRKGDEKGYFRFGGSMVISLFRKGTLIPENDLATQSAAGIELYAKMGDRMATISGSS